MKLKTLYLEAKYEATSSQMKAWFLECISKYFSEYKSKVGKEWNMPSFEVKSDANRAGWFKVTSWSSDGKAQASSLTVNKDLIDNEAYKRIIYHETIHYIQSNLYSYRQWANVANGGHDGFFREAMAKINSGEGSDYVTQKAEDIHSWGTIAGGKEFWVYGIKDRQGRYMFAYSKTDRPDAVTLLKSQKQLQSWKEIYAFKSNDLKYRIGKITMTKGRIGLAVEIPKDLSTVEDDVKGSEL